MPVLDALNYYTERKKWRLFAFCLMPNHLHTLVQMKPGVTVQRQMGDFHKFTGHKLIQVLRRREDQGMLSFYRSAARKRVDRDFLVWADSIAKPVLTESYLREVIEYIHSNPVKGRWALASDRSEYRYSSACFYDRGAQPVIPVSDIRDFWDKLGEAF
jgi:REP element-mobilizing transposase RayT